MRLWRDQIRIQYGPELHRRLLLQGLPKASGGAMATFLGVPADDFTLIDGNSKSFHYVAESGKGLDRNFCPDCGARLFTTNLESFPGMVFVAIGSLDRPELVQPMLEMFTKRRLKWTKPLDLPQYTSMPG
jgi:hypothetical protein